MLPNFLIIGAMKSGTGSLWHYLRMHPEIFMSEVKELNFFVEEKNWPLGLDWYQSQFEVNGGVKSIGEASTNYSKYPMFPGVPEKVAATLPEAKLIYLVRDPIARIQSMYTHLRHAGYETRSFEEAVRDPANRHYFNVSMYYFQLSQYLPYFSKDQILVVTTEDLHAKKGETLRQVFRFLGVRDNFWCPEFQSKVNQSKNKRRLNQFGRVIQNIPYPQWISASVPPAFRQLVNRVTMSTTPKPYLSDETRSELISAIKPDTDRLREFTGRDFSAWSL